LSCLRLRGQGASLPGTRLLSRHQPARRGALRAAVLITLVAAAIPSAADEELSIRFIAPPPGQPVSGETRVALDAKVPRGARVVRIELTIDAQMVAVLEKPPFEILWNAGPDFQPHLLRAIVTDDAGRAATTTLQTPQLRIGQRETVSLVTLYVSVEDARERPAVDLHASDFSIYEDGVGQVIVHFSSARQPLSVVLLLDSSNSMGIGDRLEIARRASIDFIKQMDARDRLLVLSFNDTVQEVQPFTTDPKRLERAIRSITAGGGTALYDALVAAASRLQGLNGRKAVVLLSDGRDQALKENAPGSLHLFEEALDAAVRAEVVVYAIGLGARLDEETDLTQRWSLRQILGALAGKTGGRFYNPERAGQLTGVYRQISEDLNRRYTLSYSPNNAARDGGWRAIRVQVRPPGMKITTRPGYFAPSPPPS